MSQATYKLTYFNVRGRAETSRFIFAQAGVKYEDKRIEQAEWSQLKPSTPTGQLPLLEVDGKQLPGSRPITRFLAERFGLAGSNDFEDAEIASIVDVLYDFTMKMVGFYYEKDEERRGQLKKALIDEHIPKYWGAIEKRFQNNKSAGDWVYGDRPTYADFGIHNTIEHATLITPDFLTTYPGVAKIKAAVETLPNIAKWLKERPKTEH